MYNNRVLEEIKSRIDILDFVSGYVRLKKSGHNWKGLCPFHTEKTPSFMVNPARQIFHCFGCNTGGDLISFLMKYENIPFGEALRILADRAGIQLKEHRGDRKALEHEEQLRNALGEAASFFEKTLRTPKSPAAAYLSTRGVSEASIATFQIGAAPAGWDGLRRHLGRAGFSEDIIRSAGLTVEGKRGPYDMFRNRLMFPIASANGSIIAFGGRALDDSMPKYINSPETAVFRKSETLYGLAQARQEIRSRDQVLIVEGYLDVIVCHQYGFPHAVAPLGTALTPGHLTRLRKLTDRAVLLFDGDPAGIAAAKKSLPLMLAHAFRVSLLVLPQGEDPDSYLRSQGSDALGSLLASSAQTAVGFMLAHSEGRHAAIIREALDVIAAAQDPLAAEEMLIELAGMTRISEAVLREEFRKRRKAVADTSKNAYNKDRRSAVRKEEHILLGAVIAFPDRLGAVLDQVNPATFRDPVVSSLLRRFSSLTEGGRLTDVLGSAAPEEQELFTRLSVDPGFDPEQVDQNIDDCIRSILRLDIDRRLREAEQSGDLVLFQELLKEKSHLARGKGT